ncbi:MAG: hypothetical protein DRQ14_08075 [Candidatus Latescibacterota bacterium]|nr:MAG: hypothetical protein DRQ14_08075 [Candidatus Latescibacterota bacterium]
MIKRPKECCEVGTYECAVPMPLRGRTRGIDLCVADIVSALNAATLTTVASCCGYGRMDGRIDLEDGRVLIVKFPTGPRGETGPAGGGME